MAVCNIIPHQFTADDVRDTLNAGGGSVGNNWIDYFGEKAKINMWSKCKPVKYDKIEDIGDAERHSVAYGLSFVSQYGYGVFSYNALTASDWCRITDFVGYDKGMTTGFCLKNYNITRDIFNDTSSLIIYLEDDIKKITCYDVRDTLLNGYKIRCLITAKGGSGKYYVTAIPVDKQSLSFTIPHLALATQLGAGAYSVVLDIEKNGAFYGFFPNGCERGNLGSCAKVRG